MSAPEPALEIVEMHRDASRIAVSLPLGPSLAEIGGARDFPLVEDPRGTDRALIMGMFVLRPATRAWTEPLDDPAAALRAGRDWCHDVRGLEGGAAIADGSVLDAFRLTLQYGLSDAVIIGSSTVAAEGVTTPGGRAGYLWQPHGPASWPRLADRWPDLGARVAEVRRHWQRLGVLSSRRWPAQIIVSRSGRAPPRGPDPLAARILRARHPDGTRIECRILTSAAGAERLRGRAREFGLGARMDAMLLVASPEHDAEALDLPAVPRLLRDRLDVRIADHDGGRVVLSAFSAAGALPQLNLTLMRGRSLRDLLSTAAAGATAADLRLLEEFESRRALFFGGDGTLPPALAPMSLLHDGGETVVASFDARALRGL